MALTVKGSGVIANTTLTSVDLAAGTTSGDLIIVGAYGSTPAMTDPRMTLAAAVPIGAGGVWYGTDDGTGDTLAFALTAAPYSIVSWVVLDKKHGVGEVRSATGIARPTVPSLQTSAVVAVCAAGHSVVPGMPTLTEPLWVNHTQLNADFAAAAIFSWTGSPPSPEEAWANPGNPIGDRVAAATFTVTVNTIAPPCRLFPREDGLGVGGGRIYPPPKSQQGSARRFGYY